MLQFLRKNTRTIIWVILIVFIFFGANSLIMSRHKPVGEVNGKEISIRTFNDIYKTLLYSPRVQSLLTNNPSFTESQLIESVFQQIAFLHEAKKRRISVSDNDIRTTILSRFSSGGSFNPQFYEGWVKRVTGLSPRQYEEGVRSELIVQKLMANIKSDITVSNTEVEEIFYRDNRRIECAYIEIPITDFASRVTVTDQEVITYYQQHLNGFKTEAQYQITYLLFTPESYLSTIEVSDNERLEYFNMHKNELIKQTSTGTTVPRYEDVKDEIDKTITQQKADQNARLAAQDFFTSVDHVGQMKKRASENNYSCITTPIIPSSEVTSHLGYGQDLKDIFDAAQPNKPYFASTSKGYVVLSITNFIPAEIIEFSDAKEKAQQMLLHDRMYALAEEEALHIEDEIATAGKDLQTVASTLKIKTHTSAFFGYANTEIIDTTTTKKVFNLLWKKEIGEVTPPLPIKNKEGVLLCQLNAIQDPPEKQLESQREEIRKKLLEFKRYFELQKELSDILQKAKIKKFLPKDALAK